MQALRHSHVCKFAASEENPELVDMGGPEEGKLHGCVDAKLQKQAMQF